LTESQKDFGIESLKEGTFKENLNKEQSQTKTDDNKRWRKLAKKKKKKKIRC